MNMSNVVRFAEQKTDTHIVAREVLTFWSPWRRLPSRTQRFEWEVPRGDLQGIPGEPHKLGVSDKGGPHKLGVWDKGGPLRSPSPGEGRVSWALLGTLD